MFIFTRHSTVKFLRYAPTIHFEKPKPAKITLGLITFDFISSHISIIALTIEFLQFAHIMFSLKYN